MTSVWLEDVKLSRKTKVKIRVSDRALSQFEKISGADLPSDDLADLVLDEFMQNRKRFNLQGMKPFAIYKFPMSSEYGPYMLICQRTRRNNLRFISFETHIKEHNYPLNGPTTPVADVLQMESYRK